MEHNPFVFNPTIQDAMIWNCCHSNVPIKPTQHVQTYVHKPRVALLTPQITGVFARLKATCVLDYIGQIQPSPRLASSPTIHHAHQRSLSHARQQQQHRLHPHHRVRQQQCNPPSLPLPNLRPRLRVLRLVQKQQRLLRYPQRLRKLHPSKARVAKYYIYDRQS